MNPRFAQDTAIQYFSRSSGPALAEVAESIFRKILNDLELGDSVDGRRAFNDALWREIRKMPEFGYFPNMEGSDAVSTYSRKIRRDVIGPLNSRNANSRTSTSNEKGSCGNDPAALLSLAMKLTGKLPQELCRDDVLRAAHYEGDTIANQLSQAFTSYQVEQCSWAHMQSEVVEKSVQSLMAEYRQERCPPWVTLRGNLDRMREASEDPELFNFKFSDPEEPPGARPSGTCGVGHRGRAYQRRVRRSMSPGSGEVSPRKFATDWRRERFFNGNRCRSSSAASWNGSPPGPPSACGCKEFATARKRRRPASNRPASYEPVTRTGRDYGRRCIRTRRGLGRLGTRGKMGGIGDRRGLFGQS